MASRCFRAEFVYRLADNGSRRFASFRGVLSQPAALRVR
jgi:hypothetical protein